MTQGAKRFRCPSVEFDARIRRGPIHRLEGGNEAMLVSVLKDIVPESVAARKAIGDFQSMIRSKSATKLDNW